MIRLRPVTGADCIWVWRLRNDAAWRAGATSGARIPLTVHLPWFRRRLRDPLPWWTIRRWNEEVRLGLLRLDAEDALLVPNIGLTIAVCPQWRRRGVARAALGVVQDHLPGLELAARVRVWNTASLGLFDQAHWRRGPEVDGWWLYRPPPRVALQLVKG